ncbi:D-hexose-6-phosphate mutarotase [Massilia sp. W12]|uniref:D-hexose-6-phosphate mutarotase n=1 Tax=Massilia sp. W12 TaxID=3126507 RepID=UPI0030CF9772
MSTPSMCKAGNLDALELVAADGASATISLFGAHVLSWQTADGRERLLLSGKAALDGSRPVRGGIPVIFPQFSDQGAGQRHGFARTTVWQAEECGELEDGRQYVEMVLTPELLPPALAAAWPCRLRYRVTIGGQEMQLMLQVDNLGDKPLHFAAALHSYLRVLEVRDAVVHGLQGVRYTDSVSKQDGVEERSEFQLSDKYDRLYRHLLRPLALETGQGRLHLTQSGFSDAAVWNPGPADCAALPDMADDEWRDFICIEPAQISPVALPPGQSWIGRHSLLVE